MCIFHDAHLSWFPLSPSLNKWIFFRCLLYCYSKKSKLWICALYGLVFNRHIHTILSVEMPHFQATVWIWPCIMCKKKQKKTNISREGAEPSKKLQYFLISGHKYFFGADLRQAFWPSRLRNVEDVIIHYKCRVIFFFFPHHQAIHYLE